MDGGEKIVGTCQILERPYLRTAPSNPEDVRPEHVLVKSVEHVLQKAEKMEGKCRYEYAMGQLKGVRQDLSVQGLTGGFTVRVYEVCLEEALKAGDIGEYALCHAMLKELAGDKHVFERLLFQCLRGDQIVAVNAEVCRLVSLGIRNPVLTFIIHSHSHNTHQMRMSYEAMPPTQQQIYSTFSHPHQTHLLDLLLRSCGPSKLPHATISHHLILPDEAVAPFLTSVTGLASPPQDAKPLLDALRAKREQLRRVD